MIRKRMLKFNWRLGLAHILVNALALGLTILLLPGLYIVHPNRVLVLLLSGLIFGLLNAFIRPILQFAMFNFLFATFGLVLILINFILLLILGWVLEGWFESNSWFVLFLAAVLIGLFGVILENLLGLTPPVVENSAAAAQTPAEHQIEERVEAILAGDDSDEVAADQVTTTDGSQ